MKASENFLSNRLEERKKKGLLRSLSVGDSNWIDFSSNDYLGLAWSAEFAEKVEMEVSKIKQTKNGATGSRLISGNSEYAENLEQEIAKFHQAESSLIFNSGYDANCGMLACLAQKGDTYITDELIHASLIDGIRLSYANRFRFRHNDLTDLESKLQKATGNIFVVVESVYSMDGDCGKLLEISQLCEQYQAHLIVDEAHGIGIFGEKGEGLSQQLGLAGKCFARIYTFGKAPGCHGAVVVGSENLRTYLINFCRSFIYTTALPLHSLASIRVSYQLMESAQSNRKKLHELIAHFQAELAKSNQIRTIASKSAIQGILVSGNENVSRVANQLQQKGIWAKAIRSPTVPEGSERLRICLHSYNTKEEIDFLRSCLENFF